MPPGRPGSGEVMIADGASSSAGRRPAPRVITEEDFRRLQPKLVGYFRRQGLSLDDARELAQDTLLQAHRGLGSFQGRCELDTWVVSIAKKLWLKRRRDRRRLKRAAREVPADDLDAGAEPAAQTAGPEERAAAGELLAGVRRAMRRLPEEMRQALVLHVRGHKYREIADRMGVTQNRVSSLIYQARAKLRQEARGQPVDSAP